MKKIKRILQILDNITYWDTCPDDYRTDIIEFLNSEEAKQLRLNGVSRSNRKDTINNFIDITEMVIENTKVNDGKTYTDLDELPTVIEDMYDIIKK